MFFLRMQSSLGECQGVQQMVSCSFLIAHCRAGRAHRVCVNSNHLEGCTLLTRGKQPSLCKNGTIVDWGAGGT